MNATESINHPEHYTSLDAFCSCGKRIECIQVFEALPANRAAAVKYLWRAGSKGNAQDAIKDLRKAAWYATREADRLEAREASKQEEEKAPDPSTVEGTWQWARNACDENPKARVRCATWPRGKFSRYCSIDGWVDENGSRCAPPASGDAWELYTEQAPGKPAELRWPERCRCGAGPDIFNFHDNGGPYRRCSKPRCMIKTRPLKVTP